MVLRLINLALGVGMVIWAVRWWRQNHGSELYAVPLLMFGLHLIAFLSVTLLRASGYDCGLTPIFLNEWSNGLRLHGLFTLFLMAVSLQRFYHRSYL